MALFLFFFFCSALPLSFMGCVGLLCFVLFLLLYMVFCFGVLCSCLCWFALFNVVVRCLFRVVWVRSVSFSRLFLVWFVLHGVVSCCVVSHRFVSSCVVARAFAFRRLLGQKHVFRSQPMDSARGSRENATLRVELQENNYIEDGAPVKSVFSA